MAFPRGESRGSDWGGGNSGSKWRIRHKVGLEDERHLELAAGRSEAVGVGDVIGVGVKEGGGAALGELDVPRGLSGVEVIGAIGRFGGGDGVIGGEFVAEGEGEIHAAAEALGGSEN